QPLDASLMAAQYGLPAAAFGVPEFDVASGTANRQRIPVRAQAKRINRTGWKREAQVARWQSPHLTFGVVAARHEKPRFRMKGKRAHSAGMSVPVFGQRSGRHIPEIQAAIHAAKRQTVTGRAKSQRRDGNTV